MAVIAIDIGTENTKVAWLEQKNGLQILDAFLFKTPYAPSAQHKDLSQVEPGILWKEITARIPLSRVRRSQIGVGLPSNLVNIILVSLPKMSVQELSGAAIVEAKRRMIPASTPEHLFEWSMIGEGISANANKCTVAVIRTERCFVQDILNIFKHIDVVPSLIIPSCCAISALMPKDSWEKDEDTAFIDLGAGNLNISVCRLGKLVFTRSLGYSLKDIIMDIGGQLGLANEEAERIAAQEGIPSVDFDLKNKAAIADEIMRQKYDANRDLPSGASLTVSPLELRMLWQTHVERVVQELRRSFIFYKEQSEGRRIGRVYCLGGGSLLKNLIPVLSGLIGGQLQLTPPFSGIKTAKNNIYDEASGTAVCLNSAVGIALSVYAKNSKIPVVNFLPVDFRRKEAASRRNLILFVVGVFLVFIFTVIGANILMKRGSLQASINAAEAQLNGFRDVKDSLERLSRKKDKLSQELARFAELKRNLDWNSLLKKLSLIVPPDVVLRRIIIAKKDIFLETAPDAVEQVDNKDLQIRIEAEVFADYEKAQIVIENFKADMDKTGYFSRINVSPLSLEEITVLEAVAAHGDSTVTKPLAREFFLEAEVVLRDEKK